jgi:ATP-dependent DNA ligase
VSRNGRDHTARFPGIVGTPRALEGNLILDWEVAIHDRQFISRFEWLRHQAPPDLATPPLFMGFDAPYARGRTSAGSRSTSAAT